jgi:TatD DNase family protein
MKPKLFDVHTHVNFALFKDDWKEVLDRALNEGVWLANVGTQQDTSKQAIAMAEGYERGVYAIIGLHPVHTSKSYHDLKELGEGGAEFTSRGEVFDMEAYRPLAEHPKTIAIGECGLDYYRLDADTAKKQREAFIAQIELANSVNKPLMLHVREAYPDALAIVKEYAKVQANVHFFAGDWEVAKSFLDIGCTLSFTGVVTFTTDYDEVIKNAPLDRILTETDAPYITPTPFRGRRNEPSYVKYGAERMAQIRGISAEDFASATALNALKFFKMHHE